MEKTKTQEAINKMRYDCTYLMLPNSAKDTAFEFKDFEDGIGGYLTIRELIDLTFPKYKETDILETHFLLRYFLRTIEEEQEFCSLLEDKGFTDFFDGAEIVNIDPLNILTTSYGVLCKMDSIEFLNKINNQE